MSELKLSPYQNDQITDLLCSPSLLIESGAGRLAEIREAVVAQLLAVNAATLGVTAPEPAEPYTGDDYPREEYTVTLSVLADGNVLMRVYEPGTITLPGRPSEHYRAMRPEAVGTAVTDWLSGRKPRLDGPCL